jgi:RNA polymerase sigma factor (sigma-70 family)
MTPLLSNQLLRTQSDDRLTALAVAGHDRAFEAIVDRYRRPLQRYLRRLLSEALAEDVLQATFVRSWQALRSGAEVRDLRPWLYRIAHNQAVNALRAASVALPDAPQLVDAGGTAPTMSIEGEVERREELRQTLHDIGALPDRQRAALVAVAVADRPHADVAAELGLTDGALRQLLLRARTALRATATAITPYPLVGWLSAGQEVSATRVAEVAAGAGGAGLGLKAGAAVLAAGAVVASAPALRDDHRPARASHSTTQATHSAAATPIDDHGGSGQAEPAVATTRSASAPSTSSSAHATPTGTGKGSSKPSSSGSSGSGARPHRSGASPPATPGSGGSGSDDSDHSPSHRPGSNGSDDSESGDSGSGVSGSASRDRSHSDGSEDHVPSTDAGGGSGSGGGGDESSSGPGGSPEQNSVVPVPTPPPPTGEGSGYGGDSAPSVSGGD